MKVLPVPQAVANLEEDIEIVRGVLSSEGFVVRMASRFDSPSMCAEMIIELSARMAEQIAATKSDVTVEQVWDRILQGLLVEASEDSEGRVELGAGFISDLGVESNQGPSSI
jgi:hypothetical protein